MRDIVSVVDRYASNCPYNQKIRFYIGFPGSGKTTIASHATLYAACRGLNILVTCLANERAQILGGTHIHDVFALPVDSKPLGTLVAMILEKLYKNQDKVSFLESLDFLELLRDWTHLSGKHCNQRCSLATCKKQLPFWRSYCRGQQRSKSVCTTLRIFGLDIASDANRSKIVSLLSVHTNEQR